jgi:hypothetical protein
MSGYLALLWLGQQVERIRHRDISLMVSSARREEHQQSSRQSVRRPPRKSWAAPFPIKKCLTFTPSELAPTNEGVNQSRAEIGWFLDSLVTNHRWTTSSAYHPFAASGSSRTRTSKCLSTTAKPQTLAAKHSESVCNRFSIHCSRCSNFSPKLNARRWKVRGGNELRVNLRVAFKPLSSRILPLWESITTLVIPSHAPTYKRKVPSI